MSVSVSNTTTRERERPRAQAAPYDLSARGVGALLVGAGVLALAGNLVHPRYSGADVVIYGRIAHSALFVAADLVLLPALLLLTIGLVGLARRTPGTAGAVARVCAIVGGGIALTQTGIELQAVRQQARILAAAPSGDRPGAFWSTNALDRLNGALTASWIVLLLGVAPLIVALIQLTAKSAPRAIAIVGCVGAAACMCVGVIDLLSQDQGRADVAFLVGSLLLTAWVIATGYVMARTSDA